MVRGILDAGWVLGGVLLGAGEWSDAFRKLLLLLSFFTVTTKKKLCPRCFLPHEFMPRNA